MKEKKDQIVLINRCCRPKNLHKIVDSILELRHQLDDNGGKLIKLYHVVIFDKYKVSYEEIAEARNLLRERYDMELTINWWFEFRGGKEGCNHGATMLVQFASNLMSRFTEDFNPWLYILDDDNIIHPEFYKILLDHTEDDSVVIFGQRRKMDYFAGYEATPVLDSILTRENMYIGADGQLTDDLFALNVFDATRHPDSAQFLLRYEFLMENGNYEDVHYFNDHATIWKLYTAHPDKFVFDTRVAAYYNELED